MILPAKTFLAWDLVTVSENSIDACDQDLVYTIITTLNYILAARNLGGLGMRASYLTCIVRCRYSRGRGIRASYVRCSLPPAAVATEKLWREKRGCNADAPRTCAARRKT